MKPITIPSECLLKEVVVSSLVYQCAYHFWHDSICALLIKLWWKDLGSFAGWGRKMCSTPQLSLLRRPELYLWARMLQHFRQQVPLLLHPYPWSTRVTIFLTQHAALHSSKLSCNRFHVCCSTFFGNKSTLFQSKWGPDRLHSPSMFFSCVYLLLLGSVKMGFLQCHSMCPFF